MSESTWLAERFEEHRPRLRGVAYRMLGSVSEAEDAVQDAWLRFSRADTDDVQNLGAWLTTVVARICLNVLRSRRTRGEMPFEGHLPEPIVSLSSSPDPEQEALLADSLGLAMMVVLDQLAPAERVAFVLHDVFGIAFDEIGEIVGRSPAAARQLASRARRRVRGIAIDQDADIGQQRAAVDAFLAAARAGDMQALLEILDPDVVVRADFGPNRSVTGIVRGAEAVAKQAMSFRALAPFAKPALVNGAPGVVVIRAGRPFAVGALTVSRGRIVELDILGDPERLAQMDLDETVESEGDSA